MAEPLDVLCDRAKIGLSLCMLGTGSIYGTERIDNHLCFIHFHKFNLFLLTKFVTLLLKSDTVSPSVAPSSAGLKHRSQLIKSLGSGPPHGQGARRPKNTNAHRDPLSWLLGATPIQDQEE